MMRVSFLATIAAIAAGALSFAACTESSAPTEGPLVVSATIRTLALGDTVRLRAGFASSDGIPTTSESGVTWASSDETRLRVAPSGLATALAAGPVTVRATRGGSTASLDLQVRGAGVAELRIAAQSQSLIVGQVTGTSVTARDSVARPAASATLRFTSRQPGVLTVDAAGVVSAVHPGSAFIVVDANGAADSVMITVRPTAFFVEPDTLIATPGIPRQLSFQAGDSLGDARGTVLPARWTTSNAAIATVDANGLVSAHAQGVARITARFGTDSAVALVRVQEYSPPLRFVQIAMGALSGVTCGLTPAGVAWCWGAASNGLLGTSLLERCVERQLGFEPYLARRAFYSCAYLPVPISSPAPFVSISMGYDAACGLTADGRVYCWGALPVPGFAITAVPTPRLLPVAARVTSVHPPCVVTIDGAGYCWGDNSTGQIGDGTVQPASFDKPAPAGGALKWREIFATGDQSCGVTIADQGFCWGGVFVIEALGIGSDLSVFQHCSTGLCRLTPAAVLPSAAYVQIRPQPLGASYSCALLRDASIACAGITGIFSPVPPSRLVSSFIAVEGLPPGRELVSGPSGPCIVSTSDEAWCTGTSSQTGVGRAPARIRPDLKLRSLVIGRGGTCGITTDGLTYCWSANAVFAGGGTATDPPANALVLVAGQVP